MHAAVLRYFIAVVRAGSIRKASEDLNIATSALSRQIQKLEIELDTPLFERLPNGLRLTQAGTIVLRHAKTTLQDYDLVKSDIGELKGKKTGEVRIASLDSLLVRFIPDQIADYHAKHPDVDFKVTSGVHNRVTNLVAEGEADLGITFDLAHPEDTELISDIPMPLMAMVDPKHPLAGRKSVTLAECAKYDRLLHLDTEPIRSMIDVELSMLNRAGRTLVRSNNIMMLRPMVQLGLGVAFFTPIGLANELRDGSIVGVPLQGSRLDGLRLGLLVSKRRQPTHAAAAMIRQMSVGLKKLGQQLSGGRPS